MNKRMMAAILIAVVVLAIGAMSVATTCIIAEKITEQAKQLQSGPTDTEALKLFEKQWEKYEKLLSCYTRHSELENIGSSVHILSALLEEDEELFRVECSRIVMAAEHMKNTEIPYFRNIF